MALDLANVFCHWANNRTLTIWIAEKSYNMELIQEFTRQVLVPSIFVKSLREYCKMSK